MTLPRNTDSVSTMRGENCSGEVKTYRHLADDGKFVEAICWAHTPGYMKNPSTCKYISEEITADEYITMKNVIE